MSDDTQMTAYERYSEVQGTYRDLIGPLLSENPPQDMRDLANAVYLELVNKILLGRPHGSRYTLGAGCQGPLCRRAERSWQREKYKRAQERKGKTVKPYPATREYDEILDIIIAEHYDRLHKDQMCADWLVMAREKEFRRAARNGSRVST